MLDLDLINNSTLDIKINGEIVGVKEPTYSLVLKTKNFLNGTDNSKNKMKVQNEILLEFLNNNIDSKKFNEKDIMAMSNKGVTALSKFLIDTITGVEQNPN